MSPQPARADNLALIFQELVTVGERLRCNRQPVNDAQSFRDTVWAWVSTADATARKVGYTEDDVELAVFAVIAYIDESIFVLKANHRIPAFDDWARQTLQEQRYRHQRAGEIFFQYLQKLLTRTDSPQLGDLLEVYYLCMVLGFVGRYGQGGMGELRAIMQQTAEKLQRIRQISAVLSPDAMPQGTAVRQVSGDPLVRILMAVAIACVVIAIGLFVTFYIILGKGVDKLRDTTVSSRLANTEFSIRENRAL